MASEVMTQEQADAVFEQIDNNELGERIEFGEEFSPGTVNTVYPGNMPGQKIRIYDTRRGFSSDILPYMLKAVMKMQWPKNGGPMYSRKVTVIPPAGTSYCFLHPDFPDRERVVAAGCGGVRCSKPSALISVVHAQRHAETRHGDTYKTYIGHLAAQREDEQREFQRMQMDVMRQQLGQPVAAPVEVFRCEATGCRRFFDSAQGLTVHRTRDHGKGD